MNQYNLIVPNSNTIYYGTDPKSIARKVFRNFAKTNNQTRISFENNNTKQKYHFIAMTNNKLNEYEQLINTKNPNQSGGAEVQDKEFFKKLSELSGNINISIDELVKILKTKYDPETEENDKNDEMIMLVDDGIKKLDFLNKNVENINNNLTAIKKEIAPKENIFFNTPPQYDKETGKAISAESSTGAEYSTGTELSEKKGGFCSIQ